MYSEIASRTIHERKKLIRDCNNLDWLILGMLGVIDGRSYGARQRPCNFLCIIHGLTIGCEVGMARVKVRVGAWAGGPGACLEALGTREGPWMALGGRVRRRGKRPTMFATGICIDKSVQ